MVQSYPTNSMQSYSKLLTSRFFCVIVLHYSHLSCTFTITNSLFAP
nr:MAG TPA: hypothetical protein [Bacteriophage sp.]